MKFKKAFITAIGIFCCVCLLGQFAGVLPVSAANGFSAMISSEADVIRPSDKVELTLSLDGCQALAFSGEITYSADVLDFDSIESMADGWYVSAEVPEGSPNKLGILALDPSLTTPAATNSPLLKLTFTVKPTAAGQNAVVELTKASASDGKKDYRSEAYGWSLPVSAGKSDDCTLHALTVNGLIPTDFSVSASVCHFTLSFDVTEPVIVPTCDENAEVSINGPKTLSVGENTYLITVTSQSGLSQVYTLIVTRQEENADPSDANTQLDSIALSTGFLSPAFSPKTYDYLVYVLESEKTLAITPHAQSSSAVCQPVTVDFDTFDFSSPVRLTVMAENGQTLTYSLTILALPDFNGINVPGILDDPDIPPHEDPGNTPGERSGSPIRHTRLSKYLEDRGITFTVLIVVSAILLVLLIAVSVFFIVRASVLKKRVGRNKKVPKETAAQNPSADENMKDF